VHFSKQAIGGERPQGGPDGERVRAREASVAQAHDQLVRRRPLTVLLLSPDRNFRIVISLLLTRRGCTVIAGRLIEPSGGEPAGGEPAVSEPDGRERADVVLIDAGQSKATVTQSVQIAKALQPSVAVVLVAGAECPDAHGLPVLDRWGPFPDLYAAIQKADPLGRLARG
jgi:hypothetical protein